MKGRVYASSVRSSITYGSETRPLLVDVVVVEFRYGVRRSAVVVCHDQVRRQVSQGFRCRGS